MRMPTIISSSSLILASVLLAGCGIQMAPQSLYDGIAPPAPQQRPEKISHVVEPVIFQEDASNFWLPTDEDCTRGGLSQEQSYTGDHALHIIWDRGPCKWAGFGIGWDDWAGKNIADIFKYAAIQMQVRTAEGTLYGLPIVLTLEDYRSKQAWAYTANKYFEKYYLDEEWQAVTVPLEAFDIMKDGIDLNNIKQLMFELQQAGDIYIDDIELVWYEAVQPDRWMPEEDIPSSPSYPTQIFTDTWPEDTGWGIMRDACQTIEIVDKQSDGSDQMIHARWDQSVEDCYQVALGASWNDWKPIQLTDNREIRLDIKASPQSAPSIFIGLEDYERRTAFISLKAAGTTSSDWQRLSIPLHKLNGDIDLNNIKQLIIRMENLGEMYLDNISVE